MKDERLKMRSNMNDGLNILSEKKIPYIVERYDDDGIDEMIKLPKDVTGRLRECGFRVGRETFEGENVVFFKGRFFGVTAG